MLFHFYLLKMQFNEVAHVWIYIHEIQHKQQKKILQSKLLASDVHSSLVLRLEEKGEP